jgi:hypothetical protein
MTTCFEGLKRSGRQGGGWAPAPPIPCCACRCLLLCIQVTFGRDLVAACAPCVLTWTAEGLVPPKLLTAHDACYLLLNYDYCLGCLQWVEPAVHACISEAAFASRKWEAGRGVLYLLFLLAYAFTVPITFLTTGTRAMVKDLIAVRTRFL